MLRVARTIADLDGRDGVESGDVDEALGYRSAGVGRAGRLTACDACLRRAHLTGLLAPRIAGLLDRPGRERSGLLALSDEDLLEVAAGPRRAGGARPS